MTGVQIQYLLGLFFLVNSIQFSIGDASAPSKVKLSADMVRFVASVVLILASVFGRSLIG